MGWPENNTEYLDRDVFGIETSQEAAEIFYSRNTFQLDNIKSFRDFVDQDHYRSGLLPCKFVQKVVLVIDHQLPYYRAGEGYRYWKIDPPDNRKYATWKGEREMTSTEEKSWLKHRDAMHHDMTALLEYSQLKTLELYIKRRDKDAWDPRDIAPTLILLQRKGVQVTLRIVDKGSIHLLPDPSAKTTYGRNMWYDVTEFLKDPTKDERARYKQLNKKPHKFEFPSINNENFHQSAGWYRSLLAQQIELLQKLKIVHLFDWRVVDASKFKSIDEISTSNMKATIPVIQLDPKLDYDENGEVVHGPGCVCDWKCCISMKPKQRIRSIGKLYNAYFLVVSMLTSFSRSNYC